MTLKSTEYSILYVIFYFAYFKDFEDCAMVYNIIFYNHYPYVYK